MLGTGSRVGRYEIQRRLGRGGMGTVYLAQDPVLRRSVAIKVFLGDLDQPEARERFVREAQSSAALNHANIVTVHDFGDVDSQPYIVMEYIAGETLAETIRRRAPFGIVDKLRLIEELCAGVAYAHDAGVLHRDLKPTNLMIDRSGRLKILDFGVARMLGTLGSRGTALIGTPGYMAPEQISGSAVDRRSDLFSIGVVAYELLSYAEAFPGETVPTITHAVLAVNPVSLDERVPGIDPELVAIVERTLQKSMEARYPDAQTLRQDIAGVRRRLELFGGDENVTIRRERLTRTPGNVGTGSARQRADSGGGVMAGTPPPDPRRSGPDALAQRRAERIASALRQSRALLDQGDLDQALEACEQALMLDEQHPEALEVERAIRGAAARRLATNLLSDASAFMAVGDFSATQALVDQARGLAPALPDIERVEEEIRERSGRRAAIGLTSAPTLYGPSSVEPPDAGATVIVPRRRTPVPSQVPPGSTEPPPAAAPKPPSQAGRQGVAVPERRSDAPASRRPSSAAPKPQPAAKKDGDVLATLRARLASTKRTTMIAAAAVAGLVIAGAAAWLWWPSGPVPTGMVVIDAVPWGVVTGIQSADGEAQQLPQDAATPLALQLPEGTYTVTVTGPDSQAPSQVQVTVAAGTVTSAPVAQFQTISLEEYFEQYLSLTPTPAVEPAAAVPAGDGPAVPQPAAAPAAPVETQP